jgi:hypothetical protein
VNDFIRVFYHREQWVTERKRKEHGNMFALRSVNEINEITQSASYINLYFLKPRNNTEQGFDFLCDFVCFRGFSIKSAKNRIRDATAKWETDVCVIAANSLILASLFD